MSAPVLNEIDSDRGIATIRFNRPDVLNAIDTATARAFREAVRAVTARHDVRCIILAGAGRAFMAGGDVATFAADIANVPNVANDMLDALHPAILALREGDAPVIAAVRGAAAGAGFSLMLAADITVAEEGSRFLIAYDRLGASPDCGATWFLPRRLPRGRALELMLLGEALTAQEAAAVGLVAKVVAAGTLDDEVWQIACKIASGPTRAYGEFRRLIDEAPGRSLAAHLEAERRAFVAAAGTADFREGVEAFLAKRLPRFVGA
jgi:2-(1,2-epoxy-1,2-dihydrophenyl)acetyl-CoA isomerase